MPTARVNGIDLHYQIFGTSGEPLLLIHGLGAQMLLWPDEFCELLVRAGFRVIRFDNRDIGLSSKTPGEPPTRRSLIKAMLTRRTKQNRYVLADMAADAAGLLDHLGIASAHVTGVSMGGMITQQLAIDHPQKVASLCSIMSNTGDHSHGGAKFGLIRRGRKVMLGRPSEDAEQRIRDGVELNRLISGPHFEVDLVTSIMREQVARSNDVVGTNWQLLAIMASPSRNEALHNVRAPAVVIHGLLDQLVLPSGGQETARCLGDARLLMFPDMAHDLPRPRWPEIVEAIRDNAARAPITTSA